ncbi:conserved hypothetical protein [Luminiphilus syltensis NOR5-1B]|uniref:LamB/YcsF family protein n=1 Tax=Luminiphilus syltensis NOR5-1B TaxID=565045 RepID=B8KSD4_9GAMM|nr:5-oxoprolinase subunit PxpA [Luminiphilus syltensis]EED34517.1 conserved hypothetical protein [Luminiphilus syltensis NOR5-1B]
MAKAITLNCDLGEGFGKWKMGLDEEMMPLIDCANIACGFHAGDPCTIERTLELARRHKVEIGAHVSYPDLQGFGRRSMAIRGHELVNLIHYQMSALDGMARVHNKKLDYVKPHGALYNDMMKDLGLLNDVMSAVSSWHKSVDLVVMATPRDKKSVELAVEHGLNLRFEAFCDRGYTNAGYLIERGKPGALLSTEQAVDQALAVAKGELRSSKGKKLSITADTLCLHGDTPNAVAVATAIREALQGY